VGIAGSNPLAPTNPPQCPIPTLTLDAFSRRVERLGEIEAARVSGQAPGDELPDLVIHNDRARNELGWRPRPAETTIVETAESLRDLGFLDQHQ